jgi:hypothetical protein
MCGHYLQQLSIAQVFVGDVLFVGGFFHADDILRPQPCLSQQRLQLGYRQRLLEVVDCLELDALPGQDTPDLPAGASGRLLVNSDSGFLFHVISASMRCFPG